MVDRVTVSLSLLILLSVSGLHGGLSSTLGCQSVPARGTHGEGLAGLGGKQDHANFMPFMLSRNRLRCSGTCTGAGAEEGSRDRQMLQEGRLHNSEVSAECSRGWSGYKGHRAADRIHMEPALCSVSKLRGGELESERDLSRKLNTSATGLEAPVASTAVEEEVSSPARLWRHVVGTRGPRSYNGVTSKIDIDAEVKLEQDSPSEEQGGSETTTSKAEDTTTTRFVSECVLPTPRGSFRLRAYRHEGHGRSLEPVVMVAGDLTGFEGVPVRVHDQCLTSEVLGSLRCDCKQQLELALDYVSEHGGCVIYMQQEGRGIGLANKVAAYALQDGGLDTVDANRHLGFDDDLRSYEAVEYILADMGIKSVKLMTNNPFKLKCLKAMGIKVLSRIPMLVAPNVHSLAYLKAKAHRMSHLLHQLDDVEIMGEPPMEGASTPVALPLDEVGAIRGGVSDAGSGTNPGEEEGYAFGRDSVLAAIEAVREGKCVVVTDDEGRENEGDLVFAAEKATEDLLAFTIRHTSGVICASLEERRLEELRLPQMVQHNEDPKMTAFTVSVDAKRGTSTGISAGDRAITLRALADSKATPNNFNRPGHIFPLRYTTGGVLMRGGHTEAAVDLAKLAGLSPVGVLCEITTRDGKNMARVPELREFCAEHGLILTSIQDLRCLIRERQQAGVLGGAAGADPTLSCMLAR